MLAIVQSQIIVNVPSSGGINHKPGLDEFSLMRLDYSDYHLLGILRRRHLQ